MDRFTFVLQDANQPVTSETKSQIRAHAMLGHLRHKFNSSPEDIPVADVSSGKQIYNPQETVRSLETSFQVHDWQHQKHKLAHRNSLVECKTGREDCLTGEVITDVANNEHDHRWFLSQPADISVILGSYPYDGVSPAVSHKISHAFQFRKTIPISSSLPFILYINNVPTCSDRLKPSQRGSFQYASAHPSCIHGIPCPAFLL